MLQLIKSLSPAAGLPPSPWPWAVFFVIVIFMKKTGKIAILLNASKGLCLAPVLIKGEIYWSLWAERVGLIIRLHTRDKCLCNQQTVLVSGYDCVGDKLWKEKVLDADMLLALCPGLLPVVASVVKPACSWTKPLCGLGISVTSHVISQGQKPFALWFLSLEKRELICNPLVKGATEHTLILSLTSLALSG